ncbi:unnamed protein product [Trichogramma brassicae]|uniref:CCHC-type domain-containing protein n=1 Tax=Trichogramma brassicae TaxID=86971 RepID=A0A6H5IWC5_9HYME|nr:unnamed protein product [Trichogramma brassicae]
MCCKKAVKKTNDNKSRLNHQFEQPQNGGSYSAPRAIEPTPSVPVMTCGFCGIHEHIMMNCVKYLVTDIKIEKKEPEVITINKIEAQGVCGFCNTPGHTINNCLGFWSKQASTANNSSNDHNNQRQNYNNNNNRNNNNNLGRNNNNNNNNNNNSNNGNNSNPHRGYVCNYLFGSIEETFDLEQVVSPCKEVYRHYSPNGDDIDFCFERILHIDRAYEDQVASKEKGMNTNEPRVEKVLKAYDNDTKWLDTVALQRMVSRDVHADILRKWTENQNSIPSYNIEGETSDCSEIETMISAIAEQSRKNSTELAEVKESLATMKERHTALCEYVLDMKIDQRDIRKAALDSLAILKLQETRVQELSPSPPPPRCYDPDRINDLLSFTRFRLTENTISQQSNNFSNTRISNLDSTLHSGVRVRREYTLNSKITYADWLEHLKSELEHYDLIDFIDPEINLGDDPNVKKSKSIVQSLIISRVDKSYQSKLINIKDPHELLSKIKEIRKVENNLNVYSLKKDIYNIKMKKNESANDFCNRIDNMLKLYDSCDPKDKFTEYDKAAAFYNATQERCTELRFLVKLRKLNNENELTIEEMKSCLLQDEIDKAAKVTPPPATRAAGPTQAGGEPSKCHRCEQKGHLAPDCPLGTYKLWYCNGLPQHPRNIEFIADSGATEHITNKGFLLSSFNKCDGEITSRSQEIFSIPLTYTLSALRKSFTESNRLHFSVMFFRFTQLPLGCFGVIHRLSDTRGSAPQSAGSAKASKKRTHGRCRSKAKTGKDIAEAMKSILSNGQKRVPKHLHTDRGKEFYNKDFEAVMNKYGIHLYSTYSNLKASICERFNRTLKNYNVEAV